MVCKYYVHLHTPKLTIFFLIQTILSKKNGLLNVEGRTMTAKRQDAPAFGEGLLLESVFRGSLGLSSLLDPLDS